MNLQKLNEVETYTNLWNKFKAKFHRKKELSEPNTTEGGSNEGQDNDIPQVESKGKDSDTIDLRVLIRRIYSKKWIYLITFIVVGILSAIIIVDEPRYYTSETTMAPELENSNIGGGALSSIAQSFGVDIGQGQTTDAITPTLYPDLLNDNGFVSDLLKIRVRTSDNTVDTTYYSYLKNHQASSWLSKKEEDLKKGIGKLLPKKKDDKVSPTGSGSPEFDPYHLSEEDNGIAEALRGNIAINVDRTTGVISISTTAQDPVVAKTLADSVRTRLQSFIIQYRTSKSRRDVDYYQKLVDEALAKYEKTRRKYGQIADENTDVTLESEKSKIEDVENTMQLQYNTYTALTTQLEAARVKLRQYTPVFTTIEGAAVPIKPAGPKRMIFVVAMVFIAFIIETCFFLRKDIKNILLPEK